MREIQSLLLLNNLEVDKTVISLFLSLADGPVLSFDIFSIPTSFSGSLGGNLTYLTKQIITFSIQFVTCYQKRCYLKSSERRTIITFFYDQYVLF